MAADGTEAGGTAAGPKPLVLDVDGTFLKTDMLLECFWAGLGRAPLATLRAAVTLLGDRAGLKAELARLADLRTDLLPVTPGVAAEVAKAQAAGREVVLASASHAPLVQKLAADHGLSDRVFASDGTTNLKGAAKAEALVAAFGPRGFDYGGNERVDRAVWAEADRALVVNDPASADLLEAEGRPVTRIDAPRGRLLDVLRPQDWVKNLLLFVPLLAAHQLAPGPWLAVLLAATAFSLGASAIYVVNDLIDLAADRQHPTKRHRAFAAGRVPILRGMAAGVGAGIAGLGLAALGGWGLIGLLALYMGAALAYSLWLKRQPWLDIATLAGLFALRLVAGAVAAGVALSGFLLAFVAPVFLALGAVKRLGDLAGAATGAPLPGRGYRRADRTRLLGVAVAGAGLGGAAFVAYALSAQAAALYGRPWLLLCAALPIAAWLWRMIATGWAGAQGHDPLTFALRDRWCLGLLALALAATGLAAL